MFDIILILVHVLSGPIDCSLDNIEILISPIISWVVLIENIPELVSFVHETAEPLQAQFSVLASDLAPNFINIAIQEPISKNLPRRFVELFKIEFLWIFVTTEMFVGLLIASELCLESLNKLHHH